MTALRWLPALVCGASGVAVLARRLVALVRRRRDCPPVVGARSHVRRVAGDPLQVLGAPRSAVADEKLQRTMAAIRLAERT